MDLFQLHCETCRTRLRVRDARVIGQIHACPKCGSMVQIAPPAGWTPPAELVATLPLAAAALGSETTASIHAQNATAESAATNYLPAALQRLFHSTALWWSAGGVAALAATGLAVGIVWHTSGSATGATSSATTADATPVATATDAPTSTGVCQGLAAAMDKQSQLELPPDDSAQQAADSQSTADFPTDSTKIASKAPDAETAIEAKPAETSQESTDTGIAAAAPIQSVATKTLKLEPLSEERSNANPATIDVPSAVTRAQYASNDAGPSPPDNEMNIRPAAKLPTVLLHYGQKTQDAAHRTNLADQVSMPIKSFEMQAAPLGRVLETLANLSAVPIAVDPAVLSAAGISPDAQVTVSAQDTTVGKLLGTVLREHHLACEIRDGQLIVIARSDR